MIVKQEARSANQLVPFNRRRTLPKRSREAIIRFLRSIRKLKSRDLVLLNALAPGFTDRFVQSSAEAGQRADRQNEDSG
jgi:hypothetical protein